MSKASSNVIKLMMRKTGATLHDFREVGFGQSAVSAIRLAERRKLKTCIIRKKGKLNRYLARW